MADATTPPEIWTCPVCAQSLDISGIGFYTTITCTRCGCEAIVHDRFANFELDGVVGVGGMSVVLHARDRVLDRPIAIKVLNETYRNQPERIARFEKECAMMAKVRHENVVDVYSAGWEGNQFYIAMELVNGRDLESIVSQNGPLRQSEVLGYARQVALGLQAARKAGLLHRDMKPGNVLITGEGKAKVLDFGLAMTQRDEDSEEVIWATPYYVAPETIFREEEDVRTDIYSLGMTMRYLLTGVDSFCDEPVHHIPELAQYKEQLPSIRTVCPYLNDSLADLVDHMTQYNAKDRPLSYESLLREMDDVAVDLAQGDALDTPEGQLRAKRRMLLAGAATLCAGVMAAAVTALLVEPGTVQGYLDGDRQLDWPLYTKACNCLSAVGSGGADASGLFAEVSALSGEPEMAAWASLHGWALAVIAQDEALAGDFARVFNEAADRIPEQAAVPGSLPASLRAIRRILADPKSSAADCSTEWQPALRGLALVIMKKDPQLARDALVHAGAPYAALCEGLPGGGRQVSSPQVASSTGKQEESPQTRAGGTADQSAAKAAPQPPAASAAVQNAYLKELLPPELHNSNDVVAIGKAAESKLAQLPAGDGVQYRRLKVIQELCRVLTIAFEQINNKLPGVVDLNATPEQMRDRLKVIKVNREHFADEVYAMLLLLHGNPEAARKANPHNSPGNTAGEPFNVLMDDWVKRFTM